jgi:hypothetical protein
MITLPQSELDKLERDYKNFSKEKIAAINKEVDRTAFAIDKRAKEDCPVNTGRLRSSIHVITNRKNTHSIQNKESGQIFDVSLPFTALPGQAYVGTTVEYAQDVEDHVMQTKNGRQPFFSPAVEIEGSKFIDNLSKILNEGS